MAVPNNAKGRLAAIEEPRPLRGDDDDAAYRARIRATYTAAPTFDTLSAIVVHHLAGATFTIETDPATGSYRVTVPTSTPAETVAALRADVDQHMPDALAVSIEVGVRDGR